MRAPCTTGQILRSVRESRGLSIDELSRVTGYSARVLEAIEQDRHILMYSEVCNLARAFGMSVDDLGAKLGE